MIDRIGKWLDRGPDSVATEEEVKAIFDKLSGGKAYVETKRFDDHAGVHAWDVEFATDDGKTEYSFRRGRPEWKELPGIRIDVVYYDKSGMPISGHSIAKRVKRIWNITP